MSPKSELFPQGFAVFAVVKTGLMGDGNEEETEWLDSLYTTDSSYWPYDRIIEVCFD